MSDRRLSLGGGVRDIAGTHSIGSVILILIRLNALAVEATLVAVLGFVSVAQDLVVTDHTFRQFGHRARARTLTLGTRVHTVFAGVRHRSTPTAEGRPEPTLFLSETNRSPQSPFLGHANVLMWVTIFAGDHLFRDVWVMGVRWRRG